MYKEQLVSVIIPCYNAEEYIIETLDSVKKQTYKNYEVIIINDHSLDNSKKLIQNSIKNDFRFRLIDLPFNMGVSNARNIGIKHAIGKYIAFLDSDDIWVPKKLEEQITFMETNNYLFTCSAYEIMNNRKIIKSIVPNEELDFNMLLCGNQIACFTVIIEKKIIENLEFENINHEDYKFWLDILKNKTPKCYCIKKKLGIYRKSNMSLSSNKLKAALWALKVIWIEVPYKILVMKYFFLYIVNSIVKHYL